jgi:tRNA G18 (ribose-2'-O)-methylase SpoU
MPEIVQAQADHPALQPFKTLRRRDNNIPDGCFIGDGRKVVRRMLESDLRLRTVVFTDRWLEFFGKSIERRTEPDLRVLVVPKEVVDGIIGYKVHQGVMALAEIPPAPRLEDLARGPSPFLVALDGVADAENVGAIVRTCAAFGVTGLIVGPGTCSPWVRRAVRVSLGGVLRVPVHATDSLPESLRHLGGRGFACVAAHIHGEHRESWNTDFTGPSCLVFGGEAEGVTPEVLAACRHVVYIPMAPGWDCLNVTASVAALLYEAARSRSGYRTQTNL